MSYYFYFVLLPHGPECNVKIMLYPFMLCVALSMALFVLCVAFLTMFVNKLNGESACL